MCPDQLDQRFFTSQFGRFLSADRFKQAAKANSSGSWNKYSYTRGDPVNRNDSTGNIDSANDGDGCYVNGTWVSGCDIGSKPTSFAPSSVFGGAKNRLEAAEAALADRTSLSVPCLQDLQAIDASRSPDQRTGSALDVFDVASTENIINGVGSTDPISALYVNPQAGNAAQYLHPGQTIGSLFGANLQGLTAMTVLGTGMSGTIYINGSLISGNLQTNEALLLHEALHSIGFDDTEVQKALGIAVDAGNTRNISDKLQKDCVSGKGNH